MIKNRKIVRSESPWLSTALRVGSQKGVYRQYNLYSPKFNEQRKQTAYIYITYTYLWKVDEFSKPIQYNYSLFFFDVCVLCVIIPTYRTIAHKILILRERMTLRYLIRSNIEITVNLCTVSCHSQP